MYHTFNADGHFVSAEKTFAAAMLVKGVHFIRFQAAATRAIPRETLRHFWS